MKIHPKDFRVAEGDEVDLEKWPTMIDPVYKSKAQYKHLLEARVEQLSAQQQLLYASNRHAILLIFQAMAGKDGGIRHVMSGVNPQGCHVFSFKHPSPRRTAARFPLAHYPRPARTRSDRHLQTLLPAEAPVLSQRAGAQSPAIDPRSRPRQGPRHRQDGGLRRLAPRAKAGRDAVRPRQTHPRLDRLRLRGPNGAHDELLLAATAQNLRKLARLIPAPAPILAT